METENERDIEEVCLVESDFETDSEDFHTIDKLSQEGEDFDSARVIERKVHEPVCDENVVALSWYDSDLNLEIDEKTFSAACPLHWKGFCFLQGGVRATHGFTSGRVCFEVKITSLCNISYTDGHLNTHLLRVGWSPYGTSLALGSDHKSYGYDSNGRASTKGSTIKDYGKTFSAGDVIGAYVDLNQRPVTMSFTVNGEDQGIAFTVPRFELNNEALFPHILSKNIAFECNFGNKSTWFAPKRGYTFVGDMPLQERIPGPRAPKNQGDCEVIMMIGLPRSGKTTWALDYCARNPGKYYIIDLMHLIDKMELMDPSRKKTYLRKSQVQGKLFKIAATRCRNYILDQVNAMRYEWEWKMKLFKNFQRRAAVSVIPHEELERRIKNEPLSKGRAWLMVLKARIAIPRPSYLLSRIDYVGLPYKEARRLLKRYNREAWVQGYKPHKHFIVPRYLFKKKTIIKKKLQLVRKGRNPVDGPSKRGRSPLSRMKDSEMSSLKKEHAGAIAFVPERIGDEFSIEPFQGDSRNSSSGFEGDVDHPRRRQATPDLAQHRRWSPPARNHTNWPPGQTSSKRASSLSPPRNIASGTGYLPEYGGRQDFHKGTSKQDCRPPQNERHGGWRPPNKDYSPSRGAGGVQRQSQEFPERGMRAGPGFETKILDHDGPLGGRAELGFQVQNKPTSLSSNPRDSVPCHHPRGRTSAQGDCYPPTRACSGGEGIMDRDCVQRQRRASDISPHGAGRCCGEGHHRTDDHFGDRFASPERGGRFCEVPNTRDDGPLKERYRDGRSEFPSQERERGPGDNLSLQRDQRISRGDGGEIPLQERRMSCCQGRRDTCAYHENRMEGKTIQNRAWASSSDSSICRERMVLGSGDRPREDMYLSVPEMHSQENYEGDWGSPNVSAVKELPPRNMRGDNEPGTTLRTYPSHEFHTAHNPCCVLGIHSPCSMSQEDSGYPEHPEKWRGRELGPSVSPVAERRVYPISRSPGGNYGRSPFSEPQDLLIIRATRVSPDLNSRNSSSRGLRRSPVPVGWADEGSSNQFRREVHEQYTRGSASQLRRESPDDLQRESLVSQQRESIVQLRIVSPTLGRRQLSNEFERESLSQLRDESLCLLRRGSPDHFRSGSPDHTRRSGSTVQYRSGSPDHPGRGSPDHFRRGSLDHMSRSPDHTRRRGSPDQQTRGSPDHSWRGSPDHRRRGSPDLRRRGSPDHYRGGSTERRSAVQFGRNSRNELGGDPSDQISRESADHFRSRSPDVREVSRSSHIRGSRESRGRGRGRGPFAPYREYVDRDSRRPFHSGSPIHRSRSPLSGPSGSPSRGRRGFPNRGSIRSGNDSPSGSRYHSTTYEPRKRSYPQRAEWHLPRGKNRNKWHPGVKHFKEKEIFVPSLHSSRAGSRGFFAPNREVVTDSSESWSSGDEYDYETIKQIFSKDDLTERSLGTLSVNLEDEEMSYDEVLDKSNFSGAARKRFKWLVQHGHSVKKAHSLALQHIPKSEKQKGAPSEEFVKKTGK